MSEEANDDQADGLTELASLLGLPSDALAAALGDDWAPGQPGSGWGHRVTIFTGVPNPRTPGRPLVAIVVDLEEGFVELGHAVGVPLPSGHMRWALGEPRTELPLDRESLREHFVDANRYDLISSEDAMTAGLLQAMREAVARIADTAMLRGVAW